MIKKLVTALSMTVLPCAAQAHDKHATEQPSAWLTLVATLANRVEILEDADYRYFNSNGIPDHQTGDFPNRQNPNAIAAQSQSFRISKNPSFTGQPMDARLFGIALNGVLFEPSTAECYGQSRGGPGAGNRPQPGMRHKPGQKPGARHEPGRRPPPGTGPRNGGPRAGGPGAGGPGAGGAQQCDWKEEAIVDGKGRLGLDRHFAHVQPNGTYHYHGLSPDLLQRGDGDMVLIGYAADGHRIMASKSDRFSPSWQLKSGNRPSGSTSPGGRYDGSYTADFEFVAGSGNLDQCNGIHIDGAYHYVMTNKYPYIPRCFMGVADRSFDKRGPR